MLVTSNFGAHLAATGLDSSATCCSGIEMSFLYAKRWRALTKNRSVVFFMEQDCGPDFQSRNRRRDEHDHEAQADI
jgi:hypothetical protein